MQRGTSANLMRGIGEGVSLPRRLVTEALGTGFLLIAVVGSGILGERLAGGNVAVALLANAVATAAALFALIECFGPLSGAHFNPVVTIAFWARGDMPAGIAAGYVASQVTGASIGVGVANAMFELSIYSFSQHARSGSAQLLSEFISTFGLVGLAWGCSLTRPSSVSGVVSAYVLGVFWFTATGFANPALTLARSLTDTFSGIRPYDVGGFVLAELLGAAAAVAVFRWLVPVHEGTKEIVPTRDTKHAEP